MTFVATLAERIAAIRYEGLPQEVARRTGRR